MKCAACGYDDKSVVVQGYRREPKLTFHEIDFSSAHPVSAIINPIGSIRLYVCPKCGTLKIEV